MIGIAIAIAEFLNNADNINAMMAVIIIVPNVMKKLERIYNNPELAIMLPFLTINRGVDNSPVPNTIIVSKTDNTYDNNVKTNPYVKNVINLLQKILYLFTGVISKNLIVPLENSDETVVPAKIIKISAIIMVALIHLFKDKNALPVYIYGSYDDI